MSMYREEAIDSLISCLRKTGFPGTQIAAAETIMALQGRFSSSGKPLSRAILLKCAGFNRSYRAIMRSEQQSHISGESEENLVSFLLGCFWSFYPFFYGEILVTDCILLFFSFVYFSTFDFIPGAFYFLLGLCFIYLFMFYTMVIV